MLLFHFMQSFQDIPLIYRFIVLVLLHSFSSSSSSKALKRGWAKKGGLLVGHMISRMNSSSLNSPQPSPWPSCQNPLSYWNASFLMWWLKLKKVKWKHVIVKKFCFPFHTVNTIRFDFHKLRKFFFFAIKQRTKMSAQAMDSGDDRYEILKHCLVGGLCSFISFTVVIFGKSFCHILLLTKDIFISENLWKTLCAIKKFLWCNYENCALKTLFQFRFHMFQGKDTFTYIQEMYLIF